jgi:hypothetical protein
MVRSLMPSMRATGSGNLSSAARTTSPAVALTASRSSGGASVTTPISPCVSALRFQLQITLRRGFKSERWAQVVGGAVPDRIKLFKAQMSRAIGGNARRTSHNPPDPHEL